MKWLPLHLRRQVHLSSYMLKILNGQSPSNFINKFKFISGGSRDGANCNLYTPKSKNLKNSYYLGAKAWNSLPVDLRNMSDPKVFGKIFKSRLLDSIINDPNYIVNNAYDYIYKLRLNFLFKSNLHFLCLAFYGCCSYLFSAGGIQH